ncbi:MAG: Thymidylate kinase [Alphaproteobacteria bacterium MarineAlpha9_Bin3]|nr:MAG: Thymidylate kinase [Alphaproteobacteria bacterium MarineAlpha9_Bin3]|tara:strand:- start:7410 stop:8042 length:633 start_codon:yes stop_codon:yes gene_type:complete
MINKKGVFITFEGGEGTGKSTQSKLLYDYFNKKNINSILTREPGGCKESEEIRNLLVNGEINKWDPITEALLHNAARKEHIKQIIKPTLLQNKIVICDRFIDSTMAYQGVGLGVSSSFLNTLSKEITENIKPDMTFIFDIDIDISLKRVKKRDKNNMNRYEKFDQSFHSNIREYFRSLINTEERYILIDASKSIEEIHLQITNYINLLIN